MNWRVSLLIVLAALGLSLQRVDDASRAAHFEAVDLWVDPAGAALAAWQVELNDPSGRVSIVGIEGGEHALFSAPPHYDSKALTGGRIVLAAFTTSDAGPEVLFRAARLHLRVEGPGAPNFAIQVQAVADVDGRSLRGASASIR